MAANSTAEVRSAEREQKCLVADVVDIRPFVQFLVIAGFPFSAKLGTLFRIRNESQKTGGSFFRFLVELFVFYPVCGPAIKFIL